MRLQNGDAVQRIEHQGMQLDAVRRKAVNDLNDCIYSGQIVLKRNKVCFCGGQTFVQLSRLERYGLPFGTQMCQVCGLISQTISLTESSLPLFYEKIYWPLNHGTSGIGGYSTHIGEKEFCDFVVSEIENRFSASLKIVEIGCGEGSKLQLLRSNLESHYALTISGCDYSSDAVQAARRKGVNAHVGGIEIILGKGAFDVIVLSHVFEHIVDLNSFLNRIEEIVDEKTLIYIEVPGVMDLKNKAEYEYDYQDFCVVAHIHNFCLSTLVSIFSSRGFVPIKGTEFVRLIVSKTGTSMVPTLTPPCAGIIEAIKEADVRRAKWLMRHNNPLRKYFANLARAVLNRIQ